MTKAIDRFEGDYRFLSNFWPDNSSTLEHHYQAAKTDDPEWAARILMAPTPNAAKKLGRKCPMIPNWNEYRLVVMRALLRMKFADTELAEMLLATGNAKLIEGNHWGDTYWGTDLEGNGLNFLGKLLMSTRKIVRIAEESTVV